MHHSWTRARRIRGGPSCFTGPVASQIHVPATPAAAVTGAGGALGVWPDRSVPGTRSSAIPATTRPIRETRGPRRLRTGAPSAKLRAFGYEKMKAIRQGRTSPKPTGGQEGRAL